MTSCLSTQILWNAENAKMFGELCRRTSRFCDAGQPCPLSSAQGQILLVSSQRSLASALHGTAPVAQASPQARTAGRPGRSAEAVR
jgi:hypothetical protein